MSSSKNMRRNILNKQNSYKHYTLEYLKLVLGHRYTKNKHHASIISKDSPGWAWAGQCNNNFFGPGSGCPSGTGSPVNLYLYLRIKIFNNFKKNRESRIKAKKFSRIERIFANWPKFIRNNQIQILVDKNHFTKLF